MRRILTAAAAAGVVLGGAGVSLAATSGSTLVASTTTATVYHGCVVGRTRVLEDVYTTKTPTCPKGSYPATWNQTGPAGAAGPAGAQGPAGAPGASNIVSITAATTVTNWPESSGWATDSFTRSLSETVDHAAPSAKCGGTPQCFFVTGQLTDNGSFQTKANAASPNGSSSATISGVLDGTMQGTADFEFYSSSNKLAAANVPVSADGSAKPASTTDWGELGFPSGTTFAGVNLTAYDWTYVAPATCEQWNDQINPGDDGQGAGDGNITGVNACTK